MLYFNNIDRQKNVKSIWNVLKYLLKNNTIWNGIVSVEWKSVLKSLKSSLNKVYTAFIDDLFLRDLKLFIIPKLMHEFK